MEIILLLIVILAAAYFATGPVRTRYSLAHASLADLQQQAQQNPTDYQVHYYLARRARLDGNYPLALDTFKQLGEADTHDQDVWLEWSQTASLSGDTGLAVGVLKTFCNVNPQNAPGHAALADLYLNNHNTPMAFSEASRATTADPNYAGGWIDLGKYYLSIDTYSKAAPDFDRAISLAPNDWRGYVGAGDVEAAQGRDTQAAVIFRKAVALNPDNGTPYERLGYTLAQSGATTDLNEAKQALGQAVAREPSLFPLDRVNAYLALGQVSERQEQWQDALTWLQKAEALNPANSPIHYELARVYKKLGDSANADRESKIHESLYSRAIEGASLTNHLKVDPGDMAARLKIARLYTSFGDYSNAIMQYRLLLQREPGNQIAQKEMEGLQRAYPDAARQAQASAP